jgi:hypothetical protein
MKYARIDPGDRGAKERRSPRPLYAVGGASTFAAATSEKPWGQAILGREHSQFKNVRGSAVCKHPQHPGNTITCDPTSP